MGGLSLGADGNASSDEDQQKPDEPQNIYTKENKAEFELNGPLISSVMSLSGEEKEGLSCHQNLDSVTSSSGSLSVAANDESFQQQPDTECSPVLVAQPHQELYGGNCQGFPVACPGMDKGGVSTRR